MLIVFVSLLLVGESSYGTPLMRTSEILQLQVGGVFLTEHLCVLIKQFCRKRIDFTVGSSTFQTFDSFNDSLQLPNLFKKWVIWSSLSRNIQLELTVWLPMCDATVTPLFLTIRVIPKSSKQQKSQKKNMLTTLSIFHWTAENHGILFFRKNNKIWELNWAFFWIHWTAAWNQNNKIAFISLKKYLTSWPWKHYSHPSVEIKVEIALAL